ncbi:MAG: glycosyltransferase family 2 protein [Proteobacteria bacterium]|nr:glycosyltransferase family 2 protein [Pseudomonadota bacterium]MDA0982648.1 glycosyltransferase family 2 protein [Pseudomonadota bacterium]
MPPNDPARARVSAVIITLNAAGQLAECLASVAFADEILVVDSGSIDGTRELAAKYGARVVTQDWLGFGRQKQAATDLAANDWVLSLDADERVSPELAASLVRALQSPAASVYRMARRNRFMGRWLRHGEGYPDWSARLYHRSKARWSDDVVHEKLLFASTPGTLEGDLLHESAEDLGRYLDKQNRYTTLAATALHEQGRTAGAAELLLSPLARFIKFYFLRLGFLDGVPGLVHVSIGCMNSFMKYAKLAELGRSPP